MERAGTLLLRLALAVLLLGVVSIYVGLAPDRVTELRIAGTWYLQRQVQTPAVWALGGLAALLTLAWAAVALVARGRFSRAMERGAVPARRVDIRSDEQLAQRARASLEPELARGRPRVERVLDALLGTPVDLGAAELSLLPGQLDVEVSLRFGMDRLPVTTMTSPVFAELLERLRLVVGIDELGHGLIELRSGETAEQIDVFIEPDCEGGPGPLVRLAVTRRSGYSRRLEELGMSEPELARLSAALEQRSGLLLFGGPAGAGLTTTIYAAAHRLYRGGRRPDDLVVVEPHVRLELPFMLQVEVGSAVPAAVLRSVLGAEHAVICVRHVVDEATAALAVQAARQRLVLVSVESDGLGGLLTRMARLVDQTALAETLCFAQAQKLLPRLCASCRQTVEPTAAQRELLGALADAGPFFQKGGCSTCHGRGYLERELVPLFWSLPVSESLRATLLRGRDLANLVQAEGSRGPLPAAMELARSGAVALADVTRVAQESW